MKKTLAKNLEQQEWFIALIEELKAIFVEKGFEARQAIIIAYHLVGKRINEDKSKFEEMGIKDTQITKRVAYFLGKHRRTIQKARQFYSMYPNLDKLPYGKAISWHKICNELLPATIENKKLDNRPHTPYGENIFYLTTKWQDSRNDAYKIIKDNQSYVPTLKRRSWFYHEDGREFSLREYAQVQTFPDEFKFIGTYEKIKDQIGNAVAPQMAKFVGKKLKGKTFGDLFAGCGGLSYGLEQIGKKALWAVERSVYFARTYKVNHPQTKVITRDIKILNPQDFEKVDIIVGGPPCQGLSLSGLRFKDDPRNELYKEFLRFVKILKPKEFLMENVPQIQQMEKQIISDFKKIDYGVEGNLICGEDIGMRQKRHRYFFIGRLNGNN